MKKFIFVFTLFLVGVFLPISFAFANLVPCGGQSEPACTWCHLMLLAQNIIMFLATTLAPIIAVLFIIYGGFIIMTSGGSPEKINKGRSIITSVAFGLVIMFSAWVIVDTLLKVIPIADDRRASLGPWNIIECEPPEPEGRNAENDLPDEEVDEPVAGIVSC